MATTRRHSPVALKGRPARTEFCRGWDVVLEYQDEGEGPCLIDLSHRPKWDVQDANLAGIRPLGVAIPETPGRCVIEKGILVSRMNRTQAAVWQFLEPTVDMPREQPYTDMTEAVCLLALVGKEVFSIMEKVTSLDLAASGRMAPFYLQGPALHVPCQMAMLEKRPEMQVLLLGCSRGYGQSMAEALLDLGSPWGLRPGGESVFTNLLKQ
jgi:hypothetical protein